MLYNNVYLPQELLAASDDDSGMYLIRAKFNLKKKHHNCFCLIVILNSNVLILCHLVIFYFLVHPNNPCPLPFFLSQKIHIAIVNLNYQDQNKCLQLKMFFQFVFYSKILALLVKNHSFKTWSGGSTRDSIDPGLELDRVEEKIEKEKTR